MANLPVAVARREVAGRCCNHLLWRWRAMMIIGIEDSGTESSGSEIGENQWTTRSSGEGSIGAWVDQRWLMAKRAEW